MRTFGEKENQVSKKSAKVIYAWGKRTIVLIGFNNNHMIDEM